MGLKEKDKKIIINYSKKYKVKEVYLFGSAVYGSEPDDIDLGVSGLAPEKFFSFFVDVSEKISRKLDLFYMDAKDAKRFAELIRKEGVLLYGK